MIRFLILFLVFGSAAFARSSSFRLHINSEPVSLSPFKQKSSSGSFLFTAIHASLLWLERGQLHPWLGTCHQSTPTQVSCHIDPKSRFSNGVQITSEHFIKTFKKFLNPRSPGLRADLLFGIKNAEAILAGKKDVKSLGVLGQGQKLTIQLESKDSEFIYNLANPILAPIFDENINDDYMTSDSIVSGPYKVSAWIPKQKMLLSPHPYSLNPSQPLIEFFFVSEDSIALNLYKKNELDFLRRVPTLHIPSYNKNPEFHQVEQFRFDYIGFAQTAHLPLTLRKALSESIDYNELQSMFSAKPRPGCPGIPATLFLKSICLDYKKIPSSISSLPQSHLVLAYSKQGGDDLDRFSQWVQSQWKKNLALEVSLQQTDNKIFFESLKHQQYPIFRVGLAPSRPTCLSVLESFLSSARENWIGLRSPEFDQIVSSLQTAKNKTQQTQWCQKGLEFLIHGYYLIPLGPISFSMLSKQNWIGWRLNELNQLNLTQLKYFHTKK